MASGSFSFETFRLDPDDRQLQRNGAPVDINARYLDALILLVSEQGKLVTKDRFLEIVWRGVPVTDEALTQCIRTLRKHLGDNAAHPRFIETVPKHGYRFIAPVAWAEADAKAASPAVPPAASPAAGAPGTWRRLMLTAAAGTAGGCAAGALGGLLYGFIGAAQSLQSGAGALSVALVMAVITALVGLLGGAGVSLGVAASDLALRRPGPWSYGLWTVMGGAGGGMIVGALVKLVGLDVFNVLFGQSPGDITGAAEGAALGGAIGLGIWAGSRTASSTAIRRSMACAGLAAGMAGVLVTLAGGRLLGGSLDLLASGFPDSRIHLDQIGALIGEAGFGPVSQAVTAGLEGALFGSCVAGAIVLARRRSGARL